MYRSRLPPLFDHATLQQFLSKYSQQWTSKHGPVNVCKTKKMPKPQRNKGEMIWSSKSCIMRVRVKMLPAGDVLRWTTLPTMLSAAWCVCSVNWRTLLFRTLDWFVVVYIKPTLPVISFEAAFFPSNLIYLWQYFSILEEPYFPAGSESVHTPMFIGSCGGCIFHFHGR